MKANARILLTDAGIWELDLHSTILSRRNCAHFHRGIDRWIRPLDRKKKIAALSYHAIK